MYHIYTFTFSYLYVEKVLFLGQIFEVEILMDLHVLRTPNPKIILLWFDLCVCLLLA